MCYFLLSWCVSCSVRAFHCSSTMAETTTPLMTHCSTAVSGKGRQTSRRRHTPEQIIRKLAKGHKLLAGGMDREDVCRQFAIAGSTWARWLAQHSGTKAGDVKRLKELTGETRWGVRCG